MIERPARHGLLEPAMETDRAVYLERQPGGAASSAPALAVIPGSWQLLAKLPVTAFAVVMATGIVSIAAAGAGQGLIAGFLRWIGAVTLVALLGLHAARVLLHRHVSAGEIGHPTTVFDPFSLVAALGVTAMALGPVLTNAALVGLWICAGMIWLTIAAATFGALVRHRGFGLIHFASGRWLLGVVSIESIAVLGVAAAMATHDSALAVIALVAWAAGIAVYPAIALTIVLRIHTRGWHAVDVTPDHWILMGALAICTLAGADLAATSTVFPSVQRSGIDAVVWTTWSCAGVLYVVLTAVSVRRWLVSSTARRADIRWWASVFPLGMYSACTFELFRVSNVAAQQDIATVTFWPALGAWVLAALMTLRAVARAVQAQA
ncbi:MAG TPA: tellurite resistance/C4-dicarboxylate transporter family protein [Candidatus Dormibacteraeota bacterium]